MTSERPAGAMQLCIYRQWIKMQGWCQFWSETSDFLAQLPGLVYVCAALFQLPALYYCHGGFSVFVSVKKNINPPWVKKKSITTCRKSHNISSLQKSYIFRETMLFSVLALFFLTF